MSAEDPKPATSPGLGRSNSLMIQDDWKRRSRSLDNPEEDEKLTQAIRDGSSGHPKMTRKSSMYISHKDSFSVPKINVEESIHLTTRSRLATVVGNVRQLRERKYNYQQGLPAISSNLKEWFACASRADEKSVMTMLLKEPILAKLPDQFMGFTALHWAVKFGKIDLARRLLAAGADVNAQTRGGFTPLHLACAHGHHEIIKLLKERGANDAITDNAGRNPWEVMRVQKYEVVKAIVVDTDSRRRATVSASANPNASGTLISGHHSITREGSRDSKEGFSSSHSHALHHSTGNLSESSAMGGSISSSAGAGAGGGAGTGSDNTLSRTLSVDSNEQQQQGATVVRRSSLRLNTAGFTKASLTIQRSEQHAEKSKITRASSRELLETSFDNTPDEELDKKDLVASTEDVSSTAATATPTGTTTPELRSTPSISIEDSSAASSSSSSSPSTEAPVPATSTSTRPPRSRTNSNSATNVSNLMAHATAQQQQQQQLHQQTSSASSSTTTTASAVPTSTATAIGRARAASNSNSDKKSVASTILAAAAAGDGTQTPPATPVESTDSKPTTASTAASTTSLNSNSSKTGSNDNLSKSSKGLTKGASAVELNWLKQESEYDIKKRQKEEEEARKKAEEEEKRKKSRVTVVHQSRVELPEDALSWRGARVAKK